MSLLPGQRLSCSPVAPVGTGILGRERQSRLFERSTKVGGSSHMGLISLFGLSDFSFRNTGLLTFD